MYKYNELMQAIQDEYRNQPSGSRLMTRKELCEKFQVTRMTVDRAISELTKSGFLYSVRGSGTYVAKPDKAKPAAGASWALVTPDVTYDIYTSILRGVGDVAGKNGISVQIYNSDDSAKKQYDIIRRLAADRVDGVILVPAITEENQDASCQLLLERKIPFVFCNRRVSAFPQIPLVCSNGYYGGYIATRHLIQQGYRRPAVLGRQIYSIVLERYYGYAAAIMEAGISLNRRHILLDLDTKTEPLGYLEIRTLLGGDEPPDSLFCINEYTLEGVYKAMQEMGLRVSDDIGIISHDNSVACLRCLPQTTAVSYPAYESGVRAGEILQDLMAGKAMTGINLFIQHPSLVERDSCLGPRSRL